MASFINTNAASLNTQRNLSKSQGALSQSIQRLSSGVRINSAKDDAAGFAIANTMDSLVRGQNVAARNVNDAISLSQTAESALSKVTENLQRMRELAVQAANGSNSYDDRAALDTEFKQRKAEVSRITHNSSFNGRNVLSGGDVTIQVGAGTTASDQLTITGADLTAPRSAVANVMRTSDSYSAYELAKRTFGSDFRDWFSVDWKSPDNFHLFGPLQTQNDTYTAAYATYLASAPASALADYNAARAAFTAAGGSLGWEGPNHFYLYGPTQAQKDTYAAAYATYLASAPASALANYNAAKATFIAAGGYLFSPLRFGVPANVPSSVLNAMNAAQAAFDATIPAAEVNAYKSALQVFDVQNEGDFDYQGDVTATVRPPQSVLNTMNSAQAAFDATLPQTELTAFDTALQLFKSQEGGFFNGSVSGVIKPPQSVLDTINAAKNAYEASIPQSIVTAYHAAVQLFTSKGGGFSVFTGEAYQGSPDQHDYDNFLIARDTYENAGKEINVLSQSSARSAIDRIDQALAEANTETINQGAIQNRLSSITRTLQTSTESQSTARSRIMDTDYAAETATLARNQILQQAGMAILAQANQLPNLITTLLK